MLCSAALHADTPSCAAFTSATGRLTHIFKEDVFLPALLVTQHDVVPALSSHLNLMLSQHCFLTECALNVHNPVCLYGTPAIAGAYLVDILFCEAKKLLFHLCIVGFSIMRAARQARQCCAVSCLHEMSCARHMAPEESADSAIYSWDATQCTSNENLPRLCA